MNSVAELFRRKDNLTKHVLEHRPKNEKCPECHKRLSNKEMVKATCEKGADNK